MMRSMMRFFRSSICVKSLNYMIRSLLPTDEPFLWEMLYHALYVPEGEPALSREIIQLPEIARYVQGWGRSGGRSGDRGCLAIPVPGGCANESQTGQPIGAVWVRLWVGEEHGYGYIDDKTPELAIAVLPDYRNQGIGTALLTQFLSAIPTSLSISLSVAETNPAWRLYDRFGFAIVSRDGSSMLMKRT
jgi:ribosomal protein S18 acetylase RimI-like enzyme